jgi:large subunit ribosomal protein L24
MKIKKTDKVLMIKGKDRGKTGTVLRVSPAGGTVVVEGLNMIKKRARARRGGEKGQMITVPRAVTASNVKLICPRCGKATRVGSKIEGDKKFRICVKCKQEI